MRTRTPEIAPPAKAEFEANVMRFLELGRATVVATAMMRAAELGKGLYIAPNQDPAMRNGMRAAAEAAARSVPASGEEAYSPHVYLIEPLKRAPIDSWWLCYFRDAPPVERVEGDEFMSADDIASAMEEFNAGAEEHAFALGDLSCRSPREFAAIR